MSAPRSGCKVCTSSHGLIIELMNLLFEFEYIQTLGSSKKNIVCCLLHLDERFKVASNNQKCTRIKLKQPWQKEHCYKRKWQKTVYIKCFNLISVDSHSCSYMDFFFTCSQELLWQRDNVCLGDCTKKSS